MNHPGFGTIDLWFITFANTGTVLAIGVGVPTYVPGMFLFGCPTDGVSFNLLSFFSLPVSLASDSVSSCSLDFSWYSDCSLLM